VVFRRLYLRNGRACDMSCRLSVCPSVCNGCIVAERSVIRKTVYRNNQLFVDALCVQNLGDEVQA